jgi:hypothetical protein
MKTFLYLIPALLLHFLPVNTMVGQNENSINQDSITADDYILVVNGIVTSKKEIWERRPNPEMGRPDRLIEIRLKLDILTVLEGVLPVDTKQLDISIIENHKLLAQNNINVGDQGVFYLDSFKNRYKLSGFNRKGSLSDLEKLDNEPRQVDTIQMKGIRWNYSNLDTNLTDKQIAQLLETPENIPGRLILRSNKLKSKALSQIAGKYKLNDAFIVTMVSNKGPFPPPGGYVYWGVCGTKNGEWFIWQPGYKELRSGKVLTDPQRYMK